MSSPSRGSPSDQENRRPNSLLSPKAGRSGFTTIEQASTSPMSGIPSSPLNFGTLPRAGNQPTQPTIAGHDTPMQLSEFSSPAGNVRPNVAPSTNASFRYRNGMAPSTSKSSPMQFSSDLASDLPTSRAGRSNRNGLFAGSGGSSLLSASPVTPRPARSDIMIRSKALQNHLSQPSEISSDPADATRVIWGTTIDIHKTEAAIKDFLLNFKLEDKLRYRDGDAFDALLINPQDAQPFYEELIKEMHATEKWSLNLDCANLLAYPKTRALYHQLIRYPQEVIPLFDHALKTIMMDMFEDDEELQERPITVRVFNTGRNVNMRDLNPQDIDQLITIKGLMTRSSSVIPDMKIAFFQCVVCDTTVTVPLDRGKVEEPQVCPNENCTGKGTMKIIHNRCLFTDRQICRLQETPDDVPDGQTPQTVSLCMYDDLVDVAKAGDRLEITGIYRAIPVRLNGRQRTVKQIFRTYVDVIHVKRTDKKRVSLDKSIVNQDEYEVNFDESDQIKELTESEVEELKALASRPDIYELLSNSVAPSIFGMDDVKKGVLLQLFGAVNKFPGENYGGPRIRGDINILIVGDPGVSKSQLLRYVHDISPRGIYTSGKGSSAVGLTAYVTKDPETKQLVLESGALVLSDGGICCIDEFDKMSEATRSVLHEVMEQQTVSIAKAGIITTLNARTSILASANPIKSQFDKKLSIVENINLPPSLMSRFDLLFLVLDRANEWDDRKLAQHIASLYLTDEPIATVDVPRVNVETLTRFITYAKNNINPKISKEAGDALVKNYVEMRQFNQSNRPKEEKSPSATTRQLESMLRLSEAHARLRFAETVEVSDVEEAYRLIKAAMQTAAIDPVTGQLDYDLIVTGHSGRQRREFDDKKKNLTELIARQPDRKKSWTISELSHIFREHLQRGTTQTLAAITEQEMRELVEALAADGHVSVAGETVVRI